jgi:hypothetical protein
MRQRGHKPRHRNLKGVDIMPKESAIRYLSWYFKLLFQKTGIQWDVSNDSDIECLVDLIIDAAVEKLKRKEE